MQRYETLSKLIQTLQPQDVIEIGTWCGENAIRMLKSMKTYTDAPSYLGYDLFEEATDDTDLQEFNVKPWADMAKVEGRIKQECPYAEVNLIKGNTRLTLEDVSIRADLAFIDGGHSLETINNDYMAVRKSSIIIFDDYYTPDEDGKCPDINVMGCNRIVEKLPHYVFPDGDWVMGGGRTHLVMVFGG